MQKVYKAEAYSEPCQTSKIEHFAKMVNKKMRKYVSVSDISLSLLLEILED